jgi:radical SAM-linked protein
MASASHCMSANKVRIRFGKTGDLRFLSHHDMLRVWERMMRRGALPFRSSQGFHPMPKISLASALGLGILGRAEVAEIELETPLAPEEVRRRLAEQAPPGLSIHSVQAIERRRTAQICRVRYFLPLSISQHPGLAERAAELMSQPECWVERAKPHHRRINIRPFLHRLAVEPAADPSDRSGEGLYMDFAVTPNGTARPDEVLQLLAVAAVLDQGAVLERTVLELHDEPLT